MKPRLPRSVLLALGLTTGCSDCNPPELGPCLEAPNADTPDPDPVPEPADVGPCLEMPPPEEPDVGPCLAPPLAPAPPPTEPTPAGDDQGALPGDARERVLARGILPADVAALLRGRQRG